jgi:hypothetical protein
VVLDLGHWTPEREALRQALRWPGKVPENVPPAVFMHLRMVSELYTRREPGLLTRSRSL